MFKKTLFLIFLALLLGACGNKPAANDTTAIDGGVWRSIDKGLTWARKSQVASVGQAQTFRNLDVSFLMFDPTDYNALYFGSIGGGLYYSYDNAESWSKAEGLGNNTIRSLSIDRSDHCTIYASFANKIHKTIDCGRQWKQIYIDQRPSATIDAVLVDHFDPTLVYQGNSAGDIMRSTDSGQSWQTIYRFKKKILKLIADPNDSRRLYADVSEKGFFFSQDGGLTWTKTDDMLKEQKLGTAIRNVVLFPGQPNLKYFATKKGIIYTEDNGENWTKIELLLPDDKAEIRSFTVNPQNRKEMYYVTDRIFYASADNGANWTPRKIKSVRRGWELLQNPEKPEILYMGYRAVPAK